MLSCLRRSKDIRAHCFQALRVEAHSSETFKPVASISSLLQWLSSGTQGDADHSWGARRALHTSTTAPGAPTGLNHGATHSLDSHLYIHTPRHICCPPSLEQFQQARPLATSTPAQRPEPDARNGGGKPAAVVHPLYNWPNAISVARLLSGPAIAGLILHGHWKTAFLSLAVSGASDWLDGFVARRYNQGSVIGSYLDPLADKVLIGCTAAALAHEGLLYTPLAALVIGRDVFLVTGAFVLRLRSLDWKWPGWQEFFRTTNSTGPESPQQESGSMGVAEGAANGTSGGLESERKKSMTQQPAPYVTPLYVSKVNTVAQIGLISGCITSAWWGWPPEGVLLGLGGATGVLTLVSGVAYVRQHRKGA